MKFAVLALLLVSNQVVAAQWSLLGDNDFGTFFVDKSSIERGRSILQANILLNWTKPQVLQGHEKYYSSEVSVAYLDCENKRIGFGSRSMYPKLDAQGGALFSPYLAFSEVRLQDTVPGSTGAQMIKSICNTK
ncbi:surface-adhesin E family protein [Herbaspirillum sp. RV1423]|uniref:surface-adhesin E family protein n=1 Tax=Herbaspirillum sp. RV1423 TaxID=1443993 RepID=UPI0004B9C2D1|nr:surface-adhesin E family protein [Herbaspirillum sp. RV1423]